MKKRKEKKKIAEKREVWTSGQLDSVPSPTETLNKLDASVLENYIRDLEALI